MLYGFSVTSLRWLRYKLRPFFRQVYIHIYECWQPLLGAWVLLFYFVGNFQIFKPSLGVASLRCTTVLKCTDARSVLAISHWPRNARRNESFGKTVKIPLTQTAAQAESRQTAERIWTLKVL